MTYCTRIIYETTGLFTTGNFFHDFIRQGHKIAPNKDCHNSTLYIGLLCTNNSEVISRFSIGPSTLN